MSKAHSGKWRVHSKVNGKEGPLSYFDKPHIAYAAYCVAASKHYGEYARVWDPDVMIEPGPRSLGNDWLGI